MMKDKKKKTFEGFEGSGPKAVNQPHLACVLLIDTSKSMEGEKLNKMNGGINRFITNIRNDDTACDTVDLAVVQFNSNVSIIQDFSPVSDIDEVKLTATGLTEMGHALEVAMDMIKAKRHQYTELGISAFKPWIVVFTDGCPTDPEKVKEVAKRINEEKKKAGGKGKITVITVYVGNQLEKSTKFDYISNPHTYLSMISTKKGIVILEEESFYHFFDWLSDSMQIISDSQVGQEPPLPVLKENSMIEKADKEILNRFLMEDDD